jgi:excisionase family DNA binding protein
VSKPASPARPVPDLTSPQLLTTIDVANLMRVSERHVQELYLSGKLKKVAGLGRSVRFRPADVVRFINANAPEVA